MKTIKVTVEFTVRTKDDDAKSVVRDMYVRLAHDVVQWAQGSCTRMLETNVEVKAVEV